MDPERALISKMVRTTDGYERMAAEGIGLQHFDDADAKATWKFVGDHIIQYGQQPSSMAVSAKFPGYDLPLVSDSLDYLKDRFLEFLTIRRGTQALERLSEAVMDPAVGCFPDMFAEEARRLQQLVTRSRVARLSDMEKRIDQYERDRASGADPWGIKTGIDFFDRWTMGIQPHEYVTISGWTGTFKSTITQWILLNAYQQGKTPMYVSLEMEAQALMRKWDTMLTNFAYDDLKAGTLSDEDMARWKKVAADVASRRATSDVITIDDVTTCTVDRVYADMQKHRPDIVAIDYISLMDTQRAVKASAMWEKMTYLTNQLKQTARTLGIPIIGVAQTNRSGATEGSTLENIAYSNSINQDSDIVIGTHASPEMKENRQMELRLNKNRDGRIGKAVIRCDLEHMRFTPLSESEAQAMGFFKGREGAASA